MDMQRPYIIWRIKVLKLQEAVEKKVLKINGGPKDDGGSGQNDQAGGSGPKDLEGSSPSSVEARLRVGRVDDNLFSIETFGTMASVYVDDPNWAPENKSLLTFFTPQCQTLEAKMARAMMVSVFGKLGDEKNIYFGNLQKCAFLAWLSSSSVTSQIPLKVYYLHEITPSLDYVGSECSSICVSWQENMEKQTSRGQCIRKRS